MPVGPGLASGEGAEHAERAGMRVDQPDADAACLGEAERLGRGGRERTEIAAELILANGTDEQVARTPVPATVIEPIRRAAVVLVVCVDLRAVAAYSRLVLVF